MAASRVIGVVRDTPSTSTVSPAGTVWSVRSTSSGTNETAVLEVRPSESVTVQMIS